MTGEITLRGRVLPIGGLKEKLYAALRAGIKTVLLPEENKKDLVEVDKEVIKNLNIICINDALSILSHTLVKPIVPLSISESANVKQIKSNIIQEKQEESTAH